MKILKFKKTKSNIYEITLEDNSKINLYDEVILKSNILYTKEVSLDELNKLLNDNNYYELYNKCLKFLKTKMRSIKEIRLKFKDYSNEDLNRVIDTLKKNNYINDDAYLKAYINDCVNLKLVGPNKIRRDLEVLGIKESDINAYLDTISNLVWQDKIKRIVDKDIRSNHKYNEIQIKQKVLNNLLNKGFYKEDIMDYLESVPISVPKDLYKKEYLKLEKKLSKKYPKEELDKEIRKRLRSKGYEEIVD